MRLINIKFIFSLVAFSFLAMVSTAQFDDLYYDPNDNSGSILDSEYTDTEDSYVYDEVDDYDSDYDSDYYDDYYDDYTYTRRINRFRRNSCRVNNYYSSVFYDDPFFSDPYLNPYFPGATSFVTIRIGNGWGFNRWNRWNRWDSYNRWNRWNNWGYSSWNSWGYNSWNNPYCPPSYGYGYANAGYYNGFNNGNIYNTNINVTNNPNGTHYGSRRNGSVSSSTNGRKASPRLTSPTRDPESGLVSSSSPSTRSDEVRNRKGDGRTSNATQSLHDGKKSDKSTRTSRRRSNGDTIYSGRKRSSRSSDSYNPNNRRSNQSQGVSRRNTNRNNNSSMSTRRNSSRNNSSFSNRSNRSSNRSSTRSSSRSSTKSSSRSNSSRSSSSRSKKRGGE